MSRCSIVRIARNLDVYLHADKVLLAYKTRQLYCDLPCQLQTGLTFAKNIVDTHTVQQECVNELYRAFLSSFVQRKCLQPKQIHLKYDTYSVALPSSGQPGIILGFSLN